MARNKLAGTKVGNSKSAKYYQDNPEAKKKKDKYNAKYGASLSRKLYRAFLNAMNKKKGKKGDGKDVSHMKGGGTVLESQKIIVLEIEGRNNYFVNSHHAIQEKKR